MRLTAQARRRQILQKAFHLFAQKGYQGTTTRQIAQSAGVTEALLFRHFSSKEELYWTVIEDRCAARQAMPRLHAMLNSGFDDITVFTAIARDILQSHIGDTRMFRLVLFTALESHKLSHRFYRHFISEYYEAVAGRVRERIGEGRFREVDPLLAARGFLGMVIYHVLIQELFGGKKYQKFELEQVSHTLATLWLDGMRAGSRAAAADSGAGEKRPAARADEEGGADRTHEPGAGVSTRRVRPFQKARV